MRLNASQFIGGMNRANYGQTLSTFWKMGIPRVFVFEFAL